MIKVLSIAIGWFCMALVAILIGAVEAILSPVILFPTETYGGYIGVFMVIGGFIFLASAVAIALVIDAFK